MKKMYELKNERAGLLDQAKEALDAGQKDDYEKCMAEVKSLNDRINAYEALDAESGRYTESSAQREMVNNMRGSSNEETVKDKNVQEILRTPEYARAFAMAIRNCESAKTANSEVYAPLQNVLKRSEDEKGGFLVPEDVNLMIREEMKTYDRLADYVTVVNTRCATGKQLVDKQPDKGFVKVEEYTDIPMSDEPSFKMVNYTTDKYADRIPITNELLNDSVENMLRYIAKWFAKKLVITENLLIVEQLNKLKTVTVAEGDELKSLMHALNVDLDPAASRRAMFLTNQSGGEAIAMLKDESGSLLVRPDITNPTKRLLDGRRVEIASNLTLPPTAEGSKVFVGDLKQAVTLYVREGLRIETTKVGGDAWAKDATEARCVVRMGAQLIEETAAMGLLLAGALAGAEETPTV